MLKFKTLSVMALVLICIISIRGNQAKASNVLTEGEIQRFASLVDQCDLSYKDGFQCDERDLRAKICLVKEALKKEGECLYNTSCNRLILWANGQLQSQTSHKLSAPCK